jgi:L1 cell adhesion molecule like protein
MLSDFFNGKQLCCSVNPEEAITYGATVMAVFLGGNDSSEKLDNLLLLDVNPLSIGVETAGGVTTTIMKRNVIVPAKQNLHIFHLV